MTMMREGNHVEGWMAVVVCILACLQLTSGWTVLRTLTGHQQQQQQQHQQSDIFTSHLPFTHQTDSSHLEQLKEPEQIEYNVMQPQNNSSQAEDIFVDIADEGPLSEIQMKILQVLLRRYLETGQESAETMITNLVNQVEKRSLHEGRHKGGRHRRQNGRGRPSGRPTRGPPRTCTFQVNVPMVYTGECRTMGRAPVQIPACDFPGNSTHQEEVMMLWVYDCI
ncbi:uncharacterized protein [Amphiura filiformis]|uniref:uncharacterized protein n=1 Tax=Amphiura filiformis TaxID=82378 RepID=UPI003B2189BA